MIFEKSSSKIWQTILPAAAESAGEKIAILGTGNEFNGDDACGVMFARLLQEKTPERPDLLILDAGLAPQNFTGLIRRFEPARVVIVDCAQMDLPPGAVALLDPAEIDGMSSSTHTFPLSMLVQYLEVEIGCHVFIIGLQPAANIPFTPLSPAVETAVQKLASSLITFLS